jgi:transposase
MSYNFLPYEKDQLFLMPPSVQEWVRDDSLARFVSEVVETLDAEGRLAGFYARYREDGWGRASYHPLMMVKVLLYAYCHGLSSSRKIAQALEQDIGFRFLAANQAPDHRTLNAFRSANVEALQGLFTQILELCRAAGLVKLGRVALDGTRVQGNSALEHKATRAQIEAAVREMLAKAEAVDREEDAQLGLDVRGDELPEPLRDGEKRKKALEAALAELDRRRDELRGPQRQLVEAREQRGGIHRGRKPKDPDQMDLPADATANLTDPESQTLSTRRGWVQGYNAQAMVDCSSQVIVAQQITQEHNDLNQLVPMLQRCEEQAGGVPGEVLADKGYWSADNFDAEKEPTKLLIAMPARAKNVKSPPSPQREAMEARMADEANQQAYEQRKCTVEPVFGQIRTRGMSAFRLRGKVKAGLEWSLWCTTHNLLKLWRAHTGRIAPAT